MLLELQQYLRQAAAQHRTVVRSGPFLARIDAHADQPYANYAFPMRVRSRLPTTSPRWCAR